MSIAQGSSTVTIGRDPASTIRVDEPTVSGLHATLTKDDDDHVLKDNNTTLGTFVNGLRCRKTRLQPGDIVQIGNAAFLFDGTQLTPASEAEGGIDLIADGLVIQAGSKRLLAEVTTTFGRNEFVALIGGSGAGKSTLLRDPADFGRQRAVQRFRAGGLARGIPADDRLRAAVRHRPSSAHRGARA